MMLKCGRVCGQARVVAHHGGGAGAPAAGRSPSARSARAGAAPRALHAAAHPQQQGSTTIILPLLHSLRSTTQKCILIYLNMPQVQQMNQAAPHLPKIALFMC